MQDGEWFYKFCSLEFIEIWKYLHTNICFVLYPTEGIKMMIFFSLG